jgi:ankyrin repeat protein
MAVSRNCGTPEIRLLLERKADPRSADMFGRTALHFAATAQVGGNGIELLIAAGANVHTVDREGKTPLHSAAANSKWTGKAGAECLLRHGADPLAEPIRAKRRSMSQVTPRRRFC